MKMVIDIPKEMYKWVYDVNKFYDNYGTGEFVELIKNGTLLEQEHCKDAISRQAVEDTIFAECSSSKLDIDFAKVLLLQRAIKDLQPVTPQESKTGHWIPVSERLPEEGGDYLTTISFDIGDEEPVREVYKNFFCILSKKWLYREHDEYVTAWMPLPEPYKEESEEV